MPTIRLKVPEDDLAIIKSAAVISLTTVNQFIVDAATERAKAVLAERRLTK